MKQLMSVTAGQGALRQEPAGPLSAGGQSPASVGLRTRCGVYLLFLSIYLVSAAGHFFTTDHIATYRTTQSLVERRSLAIQPMFEATKGRDGQYYGAFGLGQSLAVIPFYLVGKLVDSVSPPAVKSYFGGVNLRNYGGTLQFGGTVPIFFVSLFNQLITPLTCLLVFLFCLRLGFSSMTSFATTLIFGFSTAAWVYARDSFQHPLESLLLLFCVYILFSHKADLRPRHALLAGVSLAFGILTRINLLVVAPAIAIYLFYIAQKRVAGDAGFEQSIDRFRARQMLRIVAPASQELPLAGVPQAALQYLLVFVAPIILMLGVILSLNYLKFGNFLTFSAPAQAKGFSTPLWVGLYGNLFSVGRSIFLYSPPTLLALYAFRPFYHKHRAEALLFLSIIAIYLLFYSHYGYWDGGWAWGPRFLVATIPFLIIPVGYVFGNRRRMAIVAFLACLGIGVQLLGVALNYDFVYWDWLYMRPSPDNAYLFVPDISPIPTHLRDLLQGRHVDLWLLEVYQQFGIFVFLATLAVPLVVLAGALALLRPLWPSVSWSSRNASSVELGNGSEVDGGELQRDSASAQQSLGLTDSASSFGKQSGSLPYSDTDARHHLHGGENEGAVQR